jgi:hypothetical protein
MRVISLHRKGLDPQASLYDRTTHPSFSRCTCAGLHQVIVTRFPSSGSLVVVSNCDYCIQFFA